MARLVFPNAEDRLVYTALGDGQSLLSRRGLPVTIYTDAAGTTLANILTIAGAAITGSVLTVDTDSLLPLFQGPDGVDTLYAKPAGSTTTTVIYGLSFYRGALADTETAMLLRVDAGGVESVRPVTVGPADSGGAGFRVLRVAN